MKQWKITQSVNLAHNSAGVLAWPHALMVEGDKNAHVWEITIQDGRNVPDLTGASVNVYFNRADNTTVLVKGSVSGNVASVVLDQQCYAIAGPMIGIFRIATAAGTTLTVSIMRFTVGKGPYAQIIDPGEAIPNLDDFLAHLEAMDTITQTALKIQDTNGGPVDLILVQGDPGYTPVRGKDYWTEEDQEAITEEVSNQLSLEMADEIGDRVMRTILAEAKESGEFDGEDGYTPIKGTDYWTRTDQDSIVQQVLAALRTPVFGSVDAANNIILTGELADGVYTLKYEDEDGNVTVIGTLNHTNAPEPSYTNLFDLATVTLNTRMSGSSSTPKAQDGYVMTAEILIPETSIAQGSNISGSFIAIPAAYWSGSANVFFGRAGGTFGYIDCGVTPGTVVGEWVKIPVQSQWGLGSVNTTDRFIVSMHIKDSAIIASDIQDIEIYFNELPE